jgi:hypothetical protein
MTLVDEAFAPDDMNQDVDLVGITSRDITVVHSKNGRRQALI